MSVYCLSEADRRVSFTIAGYTQILRSRLDLSAIVRAVMRYELLSNYYRITSPSFSTGGLTIGGCTFDHR